MQHLQRLNANYQIVDNCANNVNIILGNFKKLHQQVTDALGLDDELDVNGVPVRPNVDKLNHAAWLYVVTVMRWCKAIIGDCVEFGDNYGLMDDMGNPVEAVTIWVPSETLILDDDFQNRINHNWELIDGVFDQLFSDYETMYQ